MSIKTIEVAIAVASAASTSAAAQSMTWIPRGPAPILDADAYTLPDHEATGAVNALVPDPANANVLFIGAVNGGVWKTTNAMAASPSWTPLTDQADSLSISALEPDPTDPTARTLVAANGLTSSILDWSRGAGLLRTIDGGATWTALHGAGALDGRDITGVAPRGSVIVISIGRWETGIGGGTEGIWRSTDAGATWAQVSGSAASGLPYGSSEFLVGDKNDPAVLYTKAGLTGIYRSADVGATWTKVSNAAIDSKIVYLGIARLAVGPANTLFVVIGSLVTESLTGFFHSADGGGTWTALDLPGGGLTYYHLSIEVDPTDSNLCYVGGDGGPIFRVDVTKPAGSQLSAISGVGATTTGTRPHADSRCIRFAANGDLIESDDGGIYRRTNPRSSAGDWYSMNGDLQVTEFHSIAWDRLGKAMIGGTQDNDTPYQIAVNGSRWDRLWAGDGGYVAVDATSTPGISTRYVSAQFLAGFYRMFFNASNRFQGMDEVSLTVVDGGPPLNPQFYTPLQLNAVDPQRMILCCRNAMYESSDQGETLRTIALPWASSGSHAIAYGASDNIDALYVGAQRDLYVRMAAYPAPMTKSPTFAAGKVRGIAIDPANSRTAFVAVNDGGIGVGSVVRTRDAGASWDVLTGNLLTLAPGILRSIALVDDGSRSILVVGADSGVYSADGPAFTVWGRFGDRLPRVPVMQLEFVRSEGLLVAGTLGRGAWTLSLGTPWMREGPAIRLTHLEDPVGIGTATPAGKLHVDVDSDGGGDLVVAGDGPQKGNVGIGTTSPDSNLTIGDRTALAAEAFVQVNSATSGGYRFGDASLDASILYNHRSDFMTFNTGGSTGASERLRITGDGVVIFTLKNLDSSGMSSLTGQQFGIGWNRSGGRGETDFFQDGGGGWRSGYDFWSERDGKSRTLLAKLQDNGNLLLLGGVGSISDAQDKTDVAPLTGALEKVQQLRGVTFKWKDPEMEQRVHVGLIAQEVQKVVPEVVLGGETHGGETEHLSVDYAALVPVLIEALKEQQKTIAQLSERLAKLEKEK